MFILSVRHYKVIGDLQFYLTQAFLFRQYNYTCENDID